MVFFLLILAIIIVVGAKVYGIGSFNENYLDKRSTTSINGIFVILVIFSHFSQYADMGGLLNKPYIILQSHLNQLVVVTFWFYSGFGMMTALKKTEGGYVNKIPAKFWKLLLKFDIAVLLYWIMNTALGTKYSVKQLLMALTAWGTVGNSNWYIFAVLVEYILLFVSFVCVKKVKGRAKYMLGLFLFTVLTIAAVYLQMKLDRPGYAYNTIIMMPVGAAYAEFRKEIERFVMKGDTSYIAALIMAVVLYVISYKERWSHGIEGFTLWIVSFICVIILFTMKVSIQNSLLEWFGKHIFSIYILQRIPMTILAHFGYVEKYMYLSLIATIGITIAIALVFEMVTDWVIRKIEESFLTRSRKGVLV